MCWWSWPSADDQATAATGTIFWPLAEGGRLLDGVLAQSEAQREALWRLRHSISEAQKHAGAGIKHDIVGAGFAGWRCFYSRGGILAAESLVPGVVVVAFGHLGDGNIHFNLNQPPAGCGLDFWPLGTGQRAGFMPWPLVWAAASPPSTASAP